MRVPIIPMPRITRISPRFVTRWLSPALLPESMGCGNFNGNHRKHISIGPMAFIDPMAGSIGIRDLSDPMDPPDLSKIPVVPTSRLRGGIPAAGAGLLGSIVPRSSQPLPILVLDSVQDRNPELCHHSSLHQRGGRPWSYLGPRRDRSRTMRSRTARNRHKQGHF